MVQHSFGLIALTASSANDGFSRYLEKLNDVLFVGPNRPLSLGVTQVLQVPLLSLTVHEIRFTRDFPRAIVVDLHVPVFITLPL